MLGLVIVVAENAERGYRRVAEEEISQSHATREAVKKKRDAPPIHQVKFVGIDPYLRGLRAKRDASLTEALDDMNPGGDVVKLVKHGYWQNGRSGGFTREVERLESELREAGLAVEED